MSSYERIFAMEESEADNGGEDPEGSTVPMPPPFFPPRRGCFFLGTEVGDNPSEPPPLTLASLSASEGGVEQEEGAERLNRDLPEDECPLLSSRLKTAQSEEA